MSSEMRRQVWHQGSTRSADEQFPWVYIKHFADGRPIGGWYNRQAPFPVPHSFFGNSYFFGNIYSLENSPYPRGFQSVANYRVKPFLKGLFQLRIHEVKYGHFIHDL